MLNRTRTLIGTLALSTLALAGCSSSSSSPTTSVAPSTTSTLPALPAQGVDASAAALLPASIRTAGVIRFMTAPGLPPGEALVGQPPRLVGLDIDLGYAMAQVLGAKASFRQAEFSAIIPAVSAGTVDAGLASIFDTPAREQLVTMVDYLRAGQLFFVPASGPTDLAGVQALCGKSVAVIKASAQEQALVTQNAVCVSSGAEQIKILTYAGQPAATKAVRSHTAQVGFVDQPIVESLVASSGGALVVSGKPFDVVPYGIATAKDAPLAQAFAAALEVLIKNGTYTQILNRWGTSAEAVATPTINGATSDGKP